MVPFSAIILTSASLNKSAKEISPKISNNIKINPTINQESLSILLFLTRITAKKNLLQEVKNLYPDLAEAKLSRKLMIKIYPQIKLIKKPLISLMLYLTRKKHLTHLIEPFL
jgi:hypothetical protein